MRAAVRRASEAIAAAAPASSATLATAEAAAAATTATATSKATTAARALLRFVDPYLAAIQSGAVELGDGIGSRLGASHRHESKASWLTSRAVHGDRYFPHLAGNGERRFEVRLSCSKRKIANEQLISHDDLSEPDRRRACTRYFGFAQTFIWIGARNSSSGASAAFVLLRMLRRRPSRVDAPRFGLGSAAQRNCAVAFPGRIYP